MNQNIMQAFNNLATAFSALEIALQTEFNNINSRFDYVEKEAITTKQTMKSAAHMILENLE